MTVQKFDDGWSVHSHIYGGCLGPHLHTEPWLIVVYSSLACKQVFDSYPAPRWSTFDKCLLEFEITTQKPPTECAKHTIGNHPQLAHQPSDKTPLHGSPDDIAIVSSDGITSLVNASSSNVVKTKAPRNLIAIVDQTEMQPWQAEFFEVIKLLQEAPRNYGKVFLMNDTISNRLVAVKRMPNKWICSSHAEFTANHPNETEMPWQDIGCVRFLNSVNYPYACNLEGLYRDKEYTYVVTSFASEGDLFQLGNSSVKPGPERENIMRPLVRQILRSFQQLHGLSIVHRDISLENILVSKDETGSGLVIRIIDFALASRDTIVEGKCGKASYQAPEMHKHKKYDGQAADVFSLGVTLFALLLDNYPWRTTESGHCQLFDYVCEHGLAACLAKRNLRKCPAGRRMLDVMSPALVRLLSGMLALDPTERLTLGEDTEWSVWDEPWLAQDLEN